MIVKKTIANDKSLSNIIKFSDNSLEFAKDLWYNIPTEEIKMIIYKVKNNINGKVYIGQTTRDLKERIQEHKRKKYSALYKPFKKYRNRELYY